MKQKHFRINLVVVAIIGDTEKQAHFGTSYNHPLGNCKVTRTKL